MHPCAFVGNRYHYMFHPYSNAYRSNKQHNLILSDQRFSPFLSAKPHHLRGDTHSVVGWFPSLLVWSEWNFRSELWFCEAWSENVGEAFVSCFGHSTFFQHVVAHVDEDLKLLFTGQFVGIITFLDDVEHHFLGSDHNSERFDDCLTCLICLKLRVERCNLGEVILPIECPLMWTPDRFDLDRIVDAQWIGFHGVFLWLFNNTRLRPLYKRL